MVNVQVAFNYRGKHWKRGFNVDAGSTVRQLKELATAARAWRGRAHNSGQSVGRDSNDRHELRSVGVVALVDSHHGLVAPRGMRWGEGTMCDAAALGVWAFHRQRRDLVRRGPASAQPSTAGQSSHLVKTASW